MKNKNFLASVLFVTILSSCALITDEYQANQRKVADRDQEIDRLKSDM
mgnify:CR=1 FL=1